MRVFCVLGLLALNGFFSTLGMAQGVTIAGVRPDQRPEGAPVIRTTKKDAGWYRQALKGVSSPYPYSLHFLENQGEWFNPFTHPGMTGPYDIRGWHRKNQP